MASILFINGCVRGEKSRTLKLARKFIAELCAKHPEYTVEEVDLNAARILPLFEDTLAVRDAATQAEDWENECFAPARQFKNADLVIFAAPFWEGTFPAAMHAYIEHICITGLTFGYSETGAPVGYCKASRAVFFSTRGGIYSQGPAKIDDHAEAFLGSVLHMLGIHKMDMITAEGLDIIGMDVDGIMREAEEKAVKLAEMF